MRTRLEEALKASMLARADRATATLRLILAALKDRDIAERGKGNPNGLSDDQIVGLLHSMIKQRHESIRLYEQGGRPDLARLEADEIEVIGQFLPPQLDDAGIAAALDEVVADSEAKTLKDMGRAMALLKERYGGRMDFARAGALLRQRLG